VRPELKQKCNVAATCHIDGGDDDGARQSSNKGSDEDSQQHGPTNGGAASQTATPAGSCRPGTTR
jgi:hypothetical protein